MADLDDRNHLFDTDRHLRAEARELFEGRGLRSLLERYAPVHVAGSYALELMVWRDLDILLDAPSITIDEFFELGRHIAALLSPFKMSFTDNRRQISKSDPRGLYWGIRLGDIKKGAWKIDLWAFDSALAQTKILEGSSMKARLNDRNRVTILRLKSLLCFDPRYRDEITSQDIYNAVLDHNAESLEDFWAYVRNKQGTP